jgi:hypothetical protein
MAPRDGSGNYTLPYPAVVDGTTIESAVYNGTMSDVATQLNGPVPIIAGGTGATNAHDAIIALKGEIAQQVVTNYDTHPFVEGSFYSAPGATSAPEATNYYSGIAHSFGIPASYIIIEATDYSGVGKRYRRVKMAGTWGAWTEQPSSVADLDARFVNLTGDTMTGPLNGTQFYATRSDGSYEYMLNGTGPNHTYGFAVASGSGGFTLDDITNGAARLQLSESGTINVPTPIASSSPTTGALTVAGGVGIGGTLNTTGNVTTAGALRVNGDNLLISRASQPTAGIIYFGNAAAGVLHYDSINFNIGGGPLKISDTTASSSPTTGALTVAGGVGIAGPLNVGGVAVYGNIPINNQGSGYTSVAADASKCIAGTGTFTINSAIYPVGTVITLAGYAGAMTVVCSGATFYWVGPSGLTSGNRNIPDRAIATIIKTPDGNWIFSGSGVT